MKKFLAIAVIAASFVACNEGEKKVDETKSTTTDTATVVTPQPAETAKVVTTTDTTVKVTTDTIKK